jgi:hypothetical protein
MAIVIVLMFRAILGLRSDGTMQIAEAVGAVGTVYVTLPAAQGGRRPGRREFRGRQETLAAEHRSDRSIRQRRKGFAWSASSTVHGAPCSVEPRCASIPFPRPTPNPPVPHDRNHRHLPASSCSC